MFSILHSLNNVLLFVSQNVVSYRNITTMKVSDPYHRLYHCPHYLWSRYFVISIYKLIHSLRLVYHLLGGLLSSNFLFSSNVLFSSSNLYLVLSFFPSQCGLFSRSALDCHNFPHHWSYQLHLRLILPSFDVPKNLHLPSEYPTRSRRSKVKIIRLLILRRY